MVTEPEQPLARTPVLERLLAATRAALARQVLYYGAGTVLGAATLWLLFAFLADWGLRVPHAIRIFHGLGLAVVLTVFLWRDLLRPLRSLPTREGIALLHERAKPELEELLISAVQFQRPGVAGDATLIDAVIRRAEATAAGLQPRAVVDPEAPRARLLLGLGGVASLAALGLWNPLYARTFLERMFGGTAAWPQRTNLVLELPGLEPGAIVERTSALLRIRLARGSDLAVLVTAEGEAPDEVTLHFDGGRTVSLNPTGSSAFRTLLQSCREDLAFHVTGGDDEDGRPRVELEVLEPPDLEGLAVVVSPPAYSGLAETRYFNQDVEVLKGSSVRVHVLPSPSTATGAVRFLPDDTTQPLSAAPFPTEGDGAARPGLSFDCVAEKSLGYRIELVDANGLSNPEPGLYRIKVLEDRAPELAVLAPERSELETVRGGALPLRVRAEDDFALADLGWRIRAGETPRDAGAPLREELFDSERPPAPPAPPESARSARDVAFGGARLELDSLGGTEAGAPKEVPIDSRFELEFFAHDHRAPQPNEGRSAPLRIRVVTPEELLRRLQDRLAEARIDALRLADEQRTKRTRIEELLDALEGDGPLETGESLALTSALAGERRVLGSAQALARTLATAAVDVLYARLDEKAAPLLEFYDARARQVLDARFQVAPWRALAEESRAGRLASEGLAATLVKLVDLALDVSEDHAAPVVAALDAAEEAATRTAVADQLAAALDQAHAVEKSLELLLAELAEWDNFQNVLTLAHDILNRQKALRERTQQFATQK